MPARRRRYIGCRSRFFHSFAAFSLDRALSRASAGNNCAISCGRGGAFRVIPTHRGLSIPAICRLRPLWSAKCSALRWSRCNSHERAKHAVDGILAEAPNRFRRPKRFVAAPGACLAPTSFPVFFNRLRGWNISCRPGSIHFFDPVGETVQVGGFKRGLDLGILRWFLIAVDPHTIDSEP